MAFEGLQDQFANLTERERRLVGILGLVLAVIIVVLPMYLISVSISDIESENDEIAAVLEELSRNRTALMERATERATAAARYGQQTPNLSAFVEEKGNAVGLAVANTTPQAVSAIGPFERERVRVTLNNVGLRPFILLLHAILTSDYPVTVTQMQIDKHRPGDEYRIVFDVTSYNRPQANNTATEDEDENENDDDSTPGRAGPPNP